MLLLCSTHRDDLPVPCPSLVPNPHVPSGGRVGSQDETKASLPPVLQYQKLKTVRGNEAHQQVGCSHRLEKACSLAFNPRLPHPAMENWWGPGMRVIACKDVGSGHHHFKYIWCVIHAYHFESLCADLTDFCLVRKSV